VPLPFPGMDPWLEHPGLWPGVHNRLIAAIADDLVPKVAPRYFVDVEQHTYFTSPAGDLAIVEPDVLIGQTGSRERIPIPAAPGTARAGVIELDVEMPLTAPVDVWYLEVRTVGNGRLVTVIEVLSPTNKSAGSGRKKYLRKRQRIAETRTSLVEIDLLRGGKPMPLSTRHPVESDYRILIGRGASRPGARLYAFGVRQAIPTIPVPLLPGDPEPSLDLNAVLHALYERARFDLRLDYSRPPVPPLAEEDAAWATELLSRR
jgi:hypothetical protein